MNKNDVVHIHKGILFSPEIGGSPHTFNNTIDFDQIMPHEISQTKISTI